MTGRAFLPEEIWLVPVSLIVGALAALLPAVRVYRIDIFKTLVQTLRILVQEVYGTHHTVCLHRTMCRAELRLYQSGPNSQVFRSNADTSLRQSGPGLMQSNDQMWKNFAANVKSRPIRIFLQHHLYSSKSRPCKVRK